MTNNLDETAAGAAKLAAGVVVSATLIAALYLGREIFVPIALAILLSFVLAPLVSLLRRCYVPRGIAVISVVFLAFVGVIVLAGVIATQIRELAGDLPQYQLTMREKIRALRGTASGAGPIGRAADVLQDLGRELNVPRIEKERGPEDPDVRAKQEPRPIPVEVRQPPATAMERIAAVVSPLLQPLMTAGIVVIFVIFILAERDDLRDRVIKLAGSRDLQKTTAALNDAARRLSKLFLTQLALNSIYGLVIGAGLWAIGVPSPVLWGVFSAILRFVPYVGATLSSVPPLVLAAATDPGWTMLALTAVLFVFSEFLLGQLIEPLAYGHTTGLSPVAVVLAAAFWTALWGPIGLVLAIPLTICLVVLGRHVESLAFLEVMLGDRPVLSPSEVFYQRMLAGDPGEAIAKAEEFLKSAPLSAYYDDVALRGLKLAQDDLERGSLPPQSAERLKAALKEVLDDLSEQEDRTPARENRHHGAVEAADSAPASARDLPILQKEQLAPDWIGPSPVLCIAGRDSLDEAAAIMLAQLIEKHGVGARVDHAHIFSASNVLPIDAAGVSLVWLSYLDASNPARIRYAVRRVRRKLPTVKVFVGCWLAADEIDAESLRQQINADGVATNLRDAARQCLEAALRDAGDPISSKDILSANVYRAPQ